ncbi:hypothetical protein K440DRAFT_639320 [Wilcoxina mikolae CBS 423.85]|nr:hypothetical protein K440DRAFT_639320 [Wilcoxina mikolae CBS 423.85]
MPPKGIKRATSEASTQKTKKSKSDNFTTHYTVENWKVFIPKRDLEAILASQSPDDWKRGIMYLMMIIFFKVRGLTLANIRSFQSVTIPQSLLSRVTDLRNWVSYVNGLLKSRLIETHWAMAEELLKRYPDDLRDEISQKAANNRKQHLSMYEIAPFQSSDDVYEYLRLETKDIFFLWAPILRDVSPEYLSMPDRSLNGGFHWLDKLKEQSYMIIARFASGVLTVIPGAEYSEHARAIDLRSTSTVHEDLPWPPMKLIDSWSDIPLELGTLIDVWPRLGEPDDSAFEPPMIAMSVPGITDYSISEHRETGGQGVSFTTIDEMDKASTMEDEETARSKYVLELLEMDRKSYQVLGAALRRREKEIEVEIATLEAMEEEAKVWRDEVKAIEERVAFRRKENAVRKQRLKEDQEANQSSFDRVHLGMAGALRPAFIFDEIDQPPIRRPVQASNSRLSFGSSNSSSGFAGMGSAKSPSMSFETFEGHQSTPVQRSRVLSNSTVTNMPFQSRCFERGDICRSVEPAPSRRSETPDQTMAASSSHLGLETEGLVDSNQESSETPAKQGSVEKVAGVISMFVSTNKPEMELGVGGIGGSGGRFEFYLVSEESSCVSEWSHSGPSIYKQNSKWKVEKWEYGSQAGVNLCHRIMHAVSRSRAKSPTLRVGRKHQRGGSAKSTNVRLRVALVRIDTNYVEAPWETILGTVMRGYIHDISRAIGRQLGNPVFEIRDWQTMAISQIDCGRDVVVVAPTGGGKSHSVESEGHQYMLY